MFNALNLVQIAIDRKFRIVDKVQWESTQVLPFQFFCYLCVALKTAAILLKNCNEWKRTSAHQSDETKFE